METQRQQINFSQISYSIIMYVGYGFIIGEPQSLRK